MGACLTVDESLKDNHKNKIGTSLSSSWLKFPTCCPYCTNHSEPSLEFQLVILGPGYTGKTTLRHHLVQRYGHAFCKADFLMYRDILQHNALDLFRDLLKEPSLNFNELKQFIKYIKYNTADDDDDAIVDVNTKTNSNSNPNSNILLDPPIADKFKYELHNVSDTEDDAYNSDDLQSTDLNVLTSSSSNMLNGLDSDHKLKIINWEAVNSNSASYTMSAISVDEQLHTSNISNRSSSKSLNICLNDTPIDINDDNVDVDIDIAVNNDYNDKAVTPTPFSSPQILSIKSPNSNKSISNAVKALNIQCTIIDENDDYNEYTVYPSKYGSISPNTPGSPITPQISSDFPNTSLVKDSSQSPPSHITVNSLSNTINTRPSASASTIFDDKLNHLQWSNSETYQSIESQNSLIIDKDDIKDDYPDQQDPDPDVVSKNVSKLTHKLQNKYKHRVTSLFNSIKDHISNKYANNKAKQNSIHQQCDQYIVNSKIDYKQKDDKDDIDPNNNSEGDVNLDKYVQYGIKSFSDLLLRLNSEDLKYGRDNGKYLILNCFRILSESFEPTFVDLLQCHVRSTGLMFENHVICHQLPVSSYNYNINVPYKQHKEDIVFKVVDVGGHRNERKKWNYVLKKDNDVIVFVVSAASFCQVLFEDFKKNAMRESLDVWKDIISSSSNNDTQFILLINKMDLFYERWSLFGQYFPEYNGNMNKQDILDYIKYLYLKIAKQYNKNIHCVCCKLTDALEVASFDIKHIREIIMNTSAIPRDIADIIIDYAHGDVFWSDIWLQPMFERKIKQYKLQKQNLMINNSNSQNILSDNNVVNVNIPSYINSIKHPKCDHINNPHQYYRHRNRKRYKKKSSSHKNKTKSN